MNGRGSILAVVAGAALMAAAGCRSSATTRAQLVVDVRLSGQAADAAAVVVELRSADQACTAFVLPLARAMIELAGSSGGDLGKVAFPVDPGTYRACATAIQANGAASATLALVQKVVTVDRGADLEITLTLRGAGSGAGGSGGAGGVGGAGGAGGAGGVMTTTRDGSAYDAIDAPATPGDGASAGPDGPDR